MKRTKESRMTKEMDKDTSKDKDWVNNGNLVLKRIKYASFVNWETEESIEQKEGNNNI